jgi:6-hydroxy-3-succinoylpyridine 3-monooxygenase
MAMTTPETGDVDVIVAGAGPVGLVTALGLAQAGVTVHVLERDPEVGRAPRALVHFPPVLEGLARLGVLEDAKAVGLPLLARSFLVAATGERITHFRDLGPRGISLGQDRLTELLLAHLARHPNAVVEQGTAVTGLAEDDRGVRVATSSGGELHAGWVVGADGARSSVRAALGVPFEGMTWPQRFIATDVRCDLAAWGGEGVTTFVIDPEVGAIVVPIERGVWRYTYSEGAPRGERVAVGEVHERLAASLPGEYELLRWSPYKMHQRAAQRFRVGRVVLTGDAAHATNPTGGLGLTAGMLDALGLQEALAAVVSGEVGEGVLDRYAALRRDTFLNLTSPLATEYKRMVFDSTDPERLETDLAVLRQLEGSVELQQEFLAAMGELATPSLLSHVDTASGGAA